MIIFYQLSWRWLCWVGLHEWLTEWEPDGKRPVVWECYVCGRKRVGK